MSSQKGLNLYPLVFGLLLVIVFSSGVTAQPNQNQPTANSSKSDVARPGVARPNVARRYFGMHFDFHANEHDSLVGQNLSEQSLDSLLTAVKPDFIQIDCKGHPGVSSYPSKVPNATTVPHFVKDPLTFYRDITKKHGVDLYLHYSGV